jgi:hypothetical protein
MPTDIDIASLISSTLIASYIAEVLTEEENEILACLAFSDEVACPVTMRGGYVAPVVQA